jgi:predicted enzyme related to lactoylglutathione lyase
MELQRNMVGWFEIPVNDMDRAIAFYQTVFDISISKHQMGPLLMGWFPALDNKPGAQGSLVYNKEFYTTSKIEGVLIYFTSQAADCAVELARVEKAGGKVLQEKKLIAPDIGYMGLFIDSEDNRVAIHSLK